METVNSKRKPDYRYYEIAKPRSDDLGPLQLLPGEWKSEGRGWNMIALPLKMPLIHRQDLITVF